ncbi:ShlB/FhaC/HecB family hemolysin secretion/activation protein, partial [Burkholderia pseudomallei]
PPDNPRQTHVALHEKRGKPSTDDASIDNPGTRATGKLQGNESLGNDNPLGLNEIFNVGFNQDQEYRDNRFGTHGWNALYSIQWGYW